MNKKFLGILAALVVLGSTSVFASAAIGAQGGYSVASGSGNGNAAITFKLSNVPAVFAADFSIANNTLYGAGITADWWMANPKAGGMIHYFYGPGIAFSLFDFNNLGFFVGGRFVAGLNIFVVKPLELYLQAAAQLGFSSYAGFAWYFPINFGFRFWF